MNQQWMIQELFQLANSMRPKLQPIHDTLTRHTLSVDCMDLQKVYDTFRHQMEFFFITDIDQGKVQIDTLIQSNTGTVDEHDATIDAHRLCGHTHPNVRNRKRSPPSSFDVHAMVVALQDKFVTKQKDILHFSHLVCAPEGLYVFTIHPIWLFQTRGFVDYTLHETYQNLDALTGGKPHLHPHMDLESFLQLSESLGVHVQYHPKPTCHTQIDIYTSSIQTIIARPYARIQLIPLVKKNENKTTPTNMTSGGVARKLQF